MTVTQTALAFLVWVVLSAGSAGLITTLWLWVTEGYTVIPITKLFVISGIIWGVLIMFYLFITYGGL